MNAYTSRAHGGCLAPFAARRLMKCRSMLSSQKGAVKKEGVAVYG